MASVVCRKLSTTGRRAGGVSRVLCAAFDSLSTVYISFYRALSTSTLPHPFGSLVHLPSVDAGEFGRDGFVALRLH